MNVEQDQHVILVFDDMKIREDLIFNKHSCEIIGFINLGEINTVLTGIEHQCTGRNISVTDET